MTAMQPRSREEAKLLGLPDWQIDQMFPAMDIEAQHDFDAPAQMPQGGLLGAPQPQQGFWQGGDKFRARDGIAGLLAVVGDAFMQQGGGQGGSVQGLLGGRLDAQEMARKKAEEQAALARLQALGAKFDMTPEQVESQVLGLRLPEPEKRKGLRPVAGPTGVFVWDADNEQFASPRGRGPGQGMTGMDEWEDIPEEEALRLRGGPGGNRPGGFRR